MTSLWRHSRLTYYDLGHHFLTQGVELLPGEVWQVSKRNSRYFRSYLRKTTGGPLPPPPSGARVKPALWHAEIWELAFIYPKHNSPLLPQRTPLNPMDSKQWWLRNLDRHSRLSEHSWDPSAPSICTGKVCTGTCCVRGCTVCLGIIAFASQVRTGRYQQVWEPLGHRSQLRSRVRGSGGESELFISSWERGECILPREQWIRFNYQRV